MDSNSQPGASGPPRKPWETTGTSSGPTPFKPPSGGSTSDVVEASGTARPGEIVSAADRTAAANRNSLGRPVPTRPWEQQQNYGGTSYGGGYNSGVNYNSSLNYNSGYGSGMYGSSYGGGLGGSLGGLGGGLGGGLYGNNMYRGGYGGGGGGLYGGSSMYGGYGGQMGGYGGQMGGYGMGMGPYGDQDPNNPYGGLPSPPGFWMSFLRVMQGVVSFFGRISILIDQNTQAFHMFMSALLQLFDRSGVLYGELARFVLRILGVKTKPGKINRQGPNGLSGPNGFPGPHNPHGNQNYLEGPKATPSGAWDNVWGENGSS